MLEDVVLLDIDGVSPVWDTYSFYLDIASPGPKVSCHFVRTDYMYLIITSARCPSLQGHNALHSKRDVSSS
jgi:hypothetical protein